MPSSNCAPPRKMVKPEMSAAPTKSASGSSAPEPRSLARRPRAAVRAVACACTDTAGNIADLQRTAPNHRVEAGARAGGGATLERISRRIVQLALVGGPVAIAFASGGFGDSPRSVAAIAAWALVALAALTWTPPPIPRSAAVGGLLLLAGWVALSAVWAPLADPARDDLVRVLLYAAVVLLSASAWRSRTEARLLEPAVALGTLVVVGYGV